MWLFSKQKKYVYSFVEGKWISKEILGGKWTNLAEMVSMWLPIPDWFTISTESCDMYYKNDKKLPQEVLDQIEHQLKHLEHHMWKRLWDHDVLLLVSIRSGAAASIPWMMDTILNLW